MDVKEVRSTIFEAANYVYTSKVYRMSQQLIDCCDFIETQLREPGSVSTSRDVRVRACNLLVDRYGGINSSLFYCYLDYVKVVKRGHGIFPEDTERFLLTLRGFVQAGGWEPGCHGDDIKDHCDDDFCD